MWDRVRIEPSEAVPGCADLFLMSSDQRAVNTVIARLPIFGVPSRASLDGDADWTFMLDVLAGINERCGRGAAVLVETSSGDSWVHVDSDA